jgi:hypothetical protein
MRYTDFDSTRLGIQIAFDLTMSDGITPTGTTYTIEKGVRFTYRIK